MSEGEERRIEGERVETGGVWRRLKTEREEERRGEEIERREENGGE